MTYQKIGTAADFCGNRDLEVVIAHGEHPDNPNIPSTVSLSASGSGCYFRWNMRAADARALAQLLIDGARQIDQLDAMEGAR